LISIVCVYNNKKIFEEYLLRSLKNQTAKFELIEVNNTQALFNSASKGLNYGGEKAKSEYIMFAHQDVVLYSKFWLEDVEKILNGLPSLGIAGCAGKTEDGEKQGFIKDRNCLWGRPFVKPIEVQTLDECILIIPKVVFRELKFDEDLQGWHAYGVDYCLTVKEKGLKVYVIPAFIYHNSLALNVKGLLEAHKKVWIKHRSVYPHIFTFPECIKKVLRPLYRMIFPPLHSDYGMQIGKYLKDCEKILFLHWDGDFLPQFRILPCLVKTESFTPENIYRKKEILHQYLSGEEIGKIRFEEKFFDVVIITLEMLSKFGEISLIVERAKKWAKELILVLNLKEFFQEGTSPPLIDLKRQGFRALKMGQWSTLRKETLNENLLYVKMLEKS